MDVFAWGGHVAVCTICTCVYNLRVWMATMKMMHVAGCS
jgi:hypothetical protein